jgi:hypothetical protein
MSRITKFVGLERLPAAPVADLARPAAWQPLHAGAPHRVEVMALGRFTEQGLASISRLQAELAGQAELRLSEVRQSCFHVTEWSHRPVDPLPGTVLWTECIKPGPSPQPQQPQSLLMLALQESVRNRVAHVLLFAKSLKDEAFSARACTELLQQNGVRLSLFQDGEDTR